MPNLLTINRLAGLVLVSAALPGCGASGVAGAATDGLTPNATTTAAAAAAAARKPIPPPPAIAAREGRIDDEPVTLELTQLRRRGRVVNLELRLQTKAEEVALNFGDALDDGVAQSISDPAATLDFEFTNSLDGINLIDGVNGRRYAPARDRFNHCICDRDIDTVTLSRARPLTLSATFGAPPPDVKAVDVVLPRFGTIADVPLG